jgi:hypothetical protein
VQGDGGMGGVHRGIIPAWGANPLSILTSSDPLA